MYLVALFFPPLGVLLCRKWVQAFLSFAMWVVSVFLVFEGLPFLAIIVLTLVIHGLLVVHQTKADQRNNQLLVASGQTSAARSRARAKVDGREMIPIVILSFGLLVVGLVVTVLALGVVASTNPELFHLKVIVEK